MTTRSTQSAPWDDDRLAAAFEARAALELTPADLTTRTLNVVRVDRPRGSLGWRQSVAALATVAVLVVALAAGVAMTGSRPIQTPATSPAAAIPSPTAKGTDVPPQAFSLPIQTVAEAIAIRDDGVDDREIAVDGWFSPTVWIPCPYMPATSPVQPVCPDESIVLMAEPESLVTRNANGYSGGTPVGPSIQIDLDDLDGAWQPGLPDQAQSQPIEIAVVGHFDDRRSTACPAEVVTACRDRFVVDRVDWANGEALATSLVDLVEGAGGPFEGAQTIIDVVRPGVAILSAVHAAGGIDLRRIEPTFADRRGGLAQEKALWIVRVLDDGALATYLFVDSTGDLYDLTADGPLLMAPITAGESNAPQPSPTPEVRSTFSFELTSPDDQPVPIDILDRAGFVTAARAATTREMARPWNPARNALTMDIDAGDLVGTEAVQLVEPPPSSVVGLEVIDVAAALQVQAKPGDDRELAVAGWFARGRVPGACARGPHMTACPKDRRDACTDAFWVDAIWQDDHLIGAQWVRGADDMPPVTLSGSRAEVLRRRGPWSDGTTTVLEVGLLRGSRFGISSRSSRVDSSPATPGCGT